MRAPATTADRVLDWVVIIVGTASLVMICYDLNVASLGRRLVVETQAWLDEQVGRARAKQDKPDKPEEDPP
jgi:hypothetical protein